MFIRVGLGISLQQHQQLTLQSDGIGRMYNKSGDKLPLDRSVILTYICTIKVMKVKPNFSFGMYTE